MLRFRLNDHNLPIKAVAIAAVVGLHAAVLGAVLIARPIPPQIEMPETVDVRFVEIAPEITQAAPAPEPVVEPDPEPEPVVEPEPTPEPEPELKPEPEPVIPEPPPEPVVEPEPEPQPEAIAEPPKPVVKPAPKPETVKPKPKPEPRPKPKPRPRPQPAATEPTASPALISAAPKAPVAPTPVDPDRPRMVGKVDYLGRRPSPEYPRVSMRRGETGRVLVRVLISPQGTVEKASVRQSSGYARLDKAALDAMAVARFKPYTENGIPYPAMADIPFDFVL